MSVVVMGMEMPEICEVCKMCTEVGTDLHCTLVDDKSATLVAGAYWRKIDNGETTRPDWCPLRPLPEKHGRLIDADSLTEQLEYYIREAGWDVQTNRVLGWVKDDFIDSEMTIVEAEG